MKENNFKDKVLRLAKWARGGKAPPYNIEVATTRSCNLRCVFCSQRLQDDCTEKVLSEDRLLKIVKEAAEMGVKEISIAGGGNHSAAHKPQ